MARRSLFHPGPTNYRNGPKRTETDRNGPERTETGYNGP